MWDLTANACSCELVPEVGTAIRSITVAGDSSLVVAANHVGTCYVWRMLRGTGLTTHFEPHHKLKAHPGQLLSLFARLQTDPCGHCVARAARHMLDAALCATSRERGPKLSMQHGRLDVCSYMRSCCCPHAQGSCVLPLASLP